LNRAVDDLKRYTCKDLVRDIVALDRAYGIRTPYIPRIFIDSDYLLSDAISGIYRDRSYRDDLRFLFRKMNALGFSELSESRMFREFARGHRMMEKSIARPPPNRQDNEENVVSDDESFSEELLSDLSDNE
jgi:hypothetical protein